MSDPAADDRASDNRTTLRKLAVVAVLMFGFGWALIPLYRAICEITGINLVTREDPGVAQRAKNTQIDTSRSIVVEFDANRQGPWSFRPKVNHMTVHPGQLVQVEYDLVNLEGRKMAGQAIPSYAPQVVTPHFKKVECFCFQEQTLQANEARQMPVVFFIDPALPRDVKNITLSYTFFEIGGAVQTASAGSGNVK